MRIGNPLRLSFARIGVYADGWMSGYSSFAQYEDAGQRSAIVTISRRAWGGKDIAGHVTIAVGTVRIGKDKEPHLGRITKVIRWTVHAHGFRRFVIPAPRPPFRVEVRISPTFVPAKLDPHSSEQREFGAQVSYAAR